MIAKKPLCDKQIKNIELYLMLFTLKRSNHFLKAGAIVIIRRVLPLSMSAYYIEIYNEWIETLIAKVFSKPIKQDLQGGQNLLSPMKCLWERGTAY